MVILEDNEGSHHKPRRLLAPEILELKEQSAVIFGSHPPNTPGLALMNGGPCETSNIVLITRSNQPKMRQIEGWKSGGKEALTMTLSLRRAAYNGRKC
jgi:hypothetical protein